MRMLITTLALVVAGSAAAQDVDDWDFADRRGVVSASVAFDAGLAVVVRCADQTVETYIAGLSLPQQSSSRRDAAYALGDAPLRDSSWQISRGGDALFADLPAPLARRFREGGRLQLRVAGSDDAPARRYVVDLPPSPAAVNRVLEACGRPAIDPRDALRRNESSSEPLAEVPEGSRWSQSPRPTYPDRALLAGISGMAVLSCTNDDAGRPTNCQVDVERPAGAGFGRAALRAARDARLETTHPAGTALTTFSIVFTTPRN